MILVAIFIGIVLVVAAVRNSQGTLFAALKEDVPAFVVWAAAILAIGAIGFIPGLKPVSRGLLTLIVVVIVLRNYQNIISGFQNVWQNPPKPGGNGSGSSTGSGSLASLIPKILQPGGVLNGTGSGTAYPSTSGSGIPSFGSPTLPGDPNDPFHYDPNQVM